MSKKDMQLLIKGMNENQRLMRERYRSLQRELNATLDIVEAAQYALKQLDAGGTASRIAWHLRQALNRYKYRDGASNR